jgi:hypothetical protein
MNEIVISDYLQSFCNDLKIFLPDDVYSCDTYGGQLDNDGEDYLNFQVNKKAQCFISLDNMAFKQGRNLMGDATFSVFVVAITNRKTKGFSTAGIDIVQRVCGFINNSDSLNVGAIARPQIEEIKQIVNTNKDEKLYNNFMITYNQKIILKQQFN